MGKFDERLIRNLELHNGWSHRTSLAVVILNISNICNRKCLMCPHGHDYIPYKPYFMDLTMVELICDQLGTDYDGSISISGLGEPTLHKDFVSIVKLIKQKCPKCELFLITNGDFLTDKITDLQELNPICISIYSEEDMIVREIRYKTYNKNKDKIFLMKRYGDTDYTFNNRAGSVWDCTGLTCNCLMPYFQVTIDTDGKVYPCSCDWKRETPLGDIYSQNIYDIFINNFKELRINLLTSNRNKNILCAKCSGGKDNFEYPASIFIDGWKKYYHLDT